MENIDPTTPLWHLTVGQFLELQKMNKDFPTVPVKEKKYEYGLKGLAKIIGCSKSKAFTLKKSGIFDSAIIQNGKFIMIDKEKVIEIFFETKDK